VERELEPGANFELASDGSPTAVVLVVDGAPLDAPPDGWTERAEVPALSIFVTGRPASPAQLLEQARRAVPEGVRAGTPFLRTVPGREAPERSQLVLPLRP
jgi:hypothetical protein